MPTLSYFLENINNLCDSIESLKFKPPGMFTNSIVTKPEITQLLKDANESEQLLYKHESEKGLLERVDGKSYFKSGEDEYSNGNTEGRRVAVNVPTLTNISEKSSESGSSPERPSRTGDAPRVYRAIIETINKLPVTDPKYVESIRQMKREYEELNGDITELQQEYDANQKALYNNNVFGMDMDEAGIDKALTREEEEVAELEREIERRRGV